MGEISRALVGDSKSPDEELPVMRSLAGLSEDQLVCRLNAKFVHEYVDKGKAFTFRYGDLNTFFGGLEGLIGPPDPHIRLAMEREHTASADSADLFTSSNYKLETTPEVEWGFVTRPGERADWPVEPALAPEKRRQPLTIAALEKALDEVNVKLRKRGEPELLVEEAFGARLYTGPMYVKYCATLRGVGRTFDGCKGNKYVTTTHVINSVIVKASKLTKLAPVYRGVAGGVLPDCFWKPDDQGVKVGVDAAFLSASYERSVARGYATELDKPGIVFEIQMGMIDRGADLRWVSQYPHEAECLFAPLTGLQLLRTRVESTLLVAEVRLSVNLVALTIEQVIAKMKQAHINLVDTLCADFRLAGAPEAALVDFDRLRRIANAREATWFNHAGNFEQATRQAFEAQRRTFERLKGGGSKGGGILERRGAGRPASVYPAIDAVVRERLAELCSRLEQHDASIFLLQADGAEGCTLLKVAENLLQKGIQPPWPPTLADLLRRLDVYEKREPLLDLLKKYAAQQQTELLRAGDRVVAYHAKYKWLNERVVQVSDADSHHVRVRFLAGSEGEKEQSLKREHVLKEAEVGLGALLREVAKIGDVESVSTLLDVGVSVFECDRDANTGLHFASREGHGAVCRKLIEKADMPRALTYAERARRLASLCNQHGVSVLTLALQTHGMGISQGT